MNEEKKDIIMSWNANKDFFYKMKEVEENLIKNPSMPNPMNDWWLGLVATKRLLVMKKDLIVNRSYFGDCRNGSFAIWDGEKFLISRNKFGSVFIEETNHFEDCEGYDVFRPYFLISQKHIDYIPHVKKRIELLRGLIDEEEKRYLSKSSTMGSSK